MAGLSTYRFPGLGTASISERITTLVQEGRVREIAQTSTLPAGVPEVSIDDLESGLKPWYKRWWVWAITGTVVVAGTVIVLRRRKSRRRK